MTYAEKSQDQIVMHLIEVGPQTRIDLEREHLRIFVPLFRYHLLVLLELGRIKLVKGKKYAACTEPKVKEEKKLSGTLLGLTLLSQEIDAGTFDRRKARRGRHFPNAYIGKRPEDDKQK